MINYDLTQFPSPLTREGSSRSKPVFTKCPSAPNISHHKLNVEQSITITVEEASPDPYGSANVQYRRGGQNKCVLLVHRTQRNIWSLVPMWYMYTSTLRTTSLEQTLTVLDAPLVT